MARLRYPLPSFPRKRESRTAMNRQSRHPPAPPTAYFLQVAV